MAKKYYDNDINKHTDWGGDESTGGLPVSGHIVQKFIKDNLEGRAGVFYRDEETDSYLVFADEENRDLYLSDREEYASLLLGSFEASSGSSNYTAELTLVSRPVNTILAGTTGNYIDLYFDIINKSGASTGDSGVVTFTFNNAGNIRTVTQICNPNELIHFLADPYLLDGKNNVSITITGRTTKAETAGAVLYTVVNLTLESTFNFSAGTGDNLDIPYTLRGAGVKYVEWYIDGVQQAAVDSIVDVYVSRTKSIDVSDLAEGKHSVQFRAYIISDSTNYYSRTLYYDFYREGPTAGGAVLLGLALDDIVPVGESPQLVAEQYRALTYRLGQYDHGRRTLSVVVTDNGEPMQELQVATGTPVDMQYVSASVGEHALGFVYQGTTLVIPITVEEGSINIRKAEEGLTLELLSRNRSNYETNPDTWVYGNYHATFSGIPFSGITGWQDGALVIPPGGEVTIDMRPLTGNVLTQGRTIEIEYECQDIEDEDGAVLSLVNEQTNAGLLITASSARLQANSGANVNTKFRDGDHLKLSFIINQTTGMNPRLMFIVNNGILERAAAFTATDSFFVDNDITIGSSSCTVKLYGIRVYNRNLSVDEAFCNFAIDSDDIIEIANRNDILDELDRIDADKVNAAIPILIITGDMQPIFDAQTTDPETYVDLDYRDMQDPTKSFTATHARMRPQGTSSLGYPRKNLRPYTGAKYGCQMYDYEGNQLENGLYSFKDGAAPVNVWTLKADYAESSGSHNTGVARLWNQVMYDVLINSEHPLRTAAQEAALASGYPYDVRTTVDGFPIVVFWHRYSTDPLVCLGQYNFNNDKSTEKVFGFVDIPGFDNSHVQCYEILENENPLALFTDETDFDTNWATAFESRYPDTDEPDLTALKRLALWVNSCENNQAKWEAEKGDYFDLPKLAAYYVYLMRFGAVDQTVKNAMLTTEDGQHWFFINYDNDTVLGIDNISTVLNRWDYTRDTSKGEGRYYYAGHSSVLWNCFEADDECIDLVQQIDAALYTAGLKYNDMLDMFDDEQSSKWCERLYNDNGSYKYIQPYLDSGANVLYMLQGSRKSYRHWWLQHRMDMYDAIWANGTFKDRAIRFIAEGAVNPPFSITSNADTYFAYGINKVMQGRPVPVNKNETHTFTVSKTLAIGDPVYIYNANHISALDLSNVVTYLTTLYLQDSVDTDGLSSLKQLILGDGVHTNSVFSGISGLNKMTSLEVLDIRGFLGITDVEGLGALRNLHYFYAANSALTTFAPAIGVSLTNVTLPACLQAITLDSCTVNSLNYSPTSTLNVVSFSNVSGSFNTKNFVLNWLNLLDDENTASLTLAGIAWTNMTVNEVLLLKKPYLTSITGTVSIGTITYDEYLELLDAFGEYVFDEDAPFRIITPPLMFVVGPTSILEGDSAQYHVEYLGGLEPGVERYSYDGTRAGTSINQDTGLLTTTENGGATANLTINCSVYDGTQVLFAQSLPMQIVHAVYPSSPSQIIVSGDRKLEVGKQYLYTFDFAYVTVTGRWTAAWSLTGDIAEYASIVSQSNTECVVTLNSAPSGDAVSGGILVSIYKASSGALCTTSDPYEIGYTDDTIAVSRLTNPAVMSRLYAVGIAASPDKCTKVEAALATVEQISNAFSMYYTEYTFDEFQYFIGIQTLAYNNDRVFNQGLRRIILPSSVKTVGYAAFSGCTNLTNITFPDGLISIGPNAFSQCAFENVVLPDSVTSIDANAFYNCGNLRSIQLPSSLATLGSGAFKGCVDLESIDIPDGVTRIEESTFQTCSSLTSIELPSNLEYIGATAFRQCNITDIVIPAATTNIYPSAFRGCENLVRITVDPNNAIHYDGGGNCIIVRSNHDLIVGCKATIIPQDVVSISTAAFGGCVGLSSIMIPSNVTGIGTSAFERCYDLTSITLSSGLTTIGSSAFYECTGLTAITIPDSVTSIGENAFKGCTALSGITFGSGLTSIGQYAFRECAGLTSIAIPDSVHEIGLNPFINCTGLTSITVGANNTYFYDGNANCIIKVSNDGLITGCKSTVIPNTVKRIEQNAFNGCASLTSIIIPDTVTTIDRAAFSGCVGLTSVVVGSGVTVIYDNAFYGCTSLATVTLGSGITSIFSSVFYNCSSLLSITIPDSVTYLGQYICYNCASLEDITFGSGISSIPYATCGNCPSLASIVFRGSVTTIGASAFTSAALSNFTFPSGLTTIDSQAFQDALLQSIVLPSSITTLNMQAFYSCDFLTEVTCGAETPPALGPNVFRESPIAHIYVPAASVAAYKGASQWSAYASIIEAIPQ